MEIKELRWKPNHPKIKLFAARKISSLGFTCHNFVLFQDNSVLVFIGSSIDIVRLKREAEDGKDLYNQLTTLTASRKCYSVGILGKYRTKHPCLNSKLPFPHYKFKDRTFQRILKSY